MKNDNQPLLVVFAGPNGSGKSTFKRMVENGYDFPEKYVNVDEIKKETNCSESEAFRQAANRCESALAHKESFAFETLLAHYTKLNFIKQAKEDGYYVRMFFICLENPFLNVKRVKERVANGGHDIPEENILGLYPKSMRYLRRAFGVVDEITVFDNSLEDMKLIAEKNDFDKIFIYPLRNYDKRSKWSRVRVEKLVGINGRPNWHGRHLRGGVKHLQC